MSGQKQHLNVLQRLREMILQGQLASGARLTEAGLAARLGVSRMPIRQSLPTLAQEGLLVASGARGFAVRTFSAAECLEALRLRAALEGLAARGMAEHGAAAGVLEAFDACLAEGDAIFAKRRVVIADEAAYAAMNERFHGLLFEDAANPLLLEFATRCNTVPFVSPAILAFDRGDLESVYEFLSFAHRQHHAIVDAIRGRDGGRAEFLLREHAITQERSMNLPKHGHAPRAADMPHAGARSPYQ